MIKVYGRPLGVVIFALILIVTSIDLLRCMPNFDLYARVNHEWPDFLLRLRFAGSYVFRLIGIIGALGVLFLYEPCRRFMVGFSWYALFTLPLRHTYQGHLFFCEPIYEQYGSSFSLATFTWIAVIIRWLIDGGFSLLFIYYFTRPGVMFCFEACKDKKSS